MSQFAPLLALLSEIPDPRRGQGQKYKLPYVLLFAILAIVTGCNSYRGIVTFIDVHRSKLNAAFGLAWRRAPAHTAIRYILQGLEPTDVEAAFRQHATRLQAACAQPGPCSIALDGKTLRGSFDSFKDRLAAQVLSAFATDTSLVLAHIDIAEKSNEIPAAHTGVSATWIRWAASSSVYCPSIGASPWQTCEAFYCRSTADQRAQQPIAGCRHVPWRITSDPRILASRASLRRRWRAW